MAVFWYILVPLAGTALIRRGWHIFRRRFVDLSLKPILDYKTAHCTSDCTSDLSGAIEYRFTGIFESLTDENIIWLKNDDLTVPVDLKGAKTFLLPNNPDEGTLEKINWNKLSILSGESKVFVGGSLVCKNNRLIFSSTPGNPLVILLYEGSDDTLVIRTIKGSRHKTRTRNTITPYSFILGAFSQAMMAVYLLNYPARRSAMITAFIALFGPFIPFIPPGVIFSLIYQRLWWYARINHAQKDISALPGGQNELVKHYSRKAWVFEILSWLVFSAGIIINLFFIIKLLSVTGALNILP